MVSGRVVNTLSVRHDPAAESAHWHPHSCRSSCAACLHARSSPGYRGCSEPVGHTRDAQKPLSHADVFHRVTALFAHTVSLRRWPTQYPTLHTTTLQHSPDRAIDGTASEIAAWTFYPSHSSRQQRNFSTLTVCYQCRRTGSTEQFCQFRYRRSFPCTSVVPGANSFRRSTASILEGRSQVCTSRSQS